MNLTETIARLRELEAKARTALADSNDVPLPWSEWRGALIAAYPALLDAAGRAVAASDELLDRYLNAVRSDGSTVSSLYEWPRDGHLLARRIEAAEAERDSLRERVAALEAGVRKIANQQRLRSFSGRTT